MGRRLVRLSESPSEALLHVAIMTATALRVSGELCVHDSLITKWRHRAGITSRHAIPPLEGLPSCRIEDSKGD
ncbi:hypothetical protein CC2G_005317 [Coprinopsis cinerea AmutBmut pab1-1]|nr:hypothetical protein CC2G_005317 [Coprinopsis cinerea AmutBmut pab1-1]